VEVKRAAGNGTHNHRALVDEHQAVTIAGRLGL
jgi:hypothetical protein